MTPADSVRADAQQNYLRILQVAREAYSDSGDVSMNKIAKLAGVGPGTLYRHFANREALVLAIYHQEITGIVRLAGELLNNHPPLEALKLWLTRLAYYGQLKYGVAEVIHAASNDGPSSDTYQSVLSAISQLLEAGKKAGQLRADIEAEELLLLVAFLWRLDPISSPAGRAEHMLTLVLQGLETRP